MEEQYKKIEYNILDSNAKKRYNISPIKYTVDNSNVNFMVKDQRDKLISKRKEFIQNYRKKQRLLTLMESNKNNENINNNTNEEISIEKIKRMIDPISKILFLKKYIYLNNSKIDITFINDNIHIIKKWFNDYKKYLFDYDNKNISKQILINRHIIYIILSFLFEPEINPLMDEFDYEFLFNINNFCFHYLKMVNDNNIKENIILYLYILFLLNNLISIHPDEELIKATIDIKNIVQLFYYKFFSFVKNNNNNIINKNNNNDTINKCNKSELLEFSFLKLIENCCIYLHLNDNDIKELLQILLSLLYYNYYTNDIKLLIYSLDFLASINHSYLLLDNNYYTNFLISVINEIISNFNNTFINDSLLLFKNKLIFELYLQRILLFLNFNDNEKMLINIDLFLKEEIIIFLKKYLYCFYNNFVNLKDKKEITKYQLKIIIKILKIYGLYFDLISINNILIKNKLEKFICTFFIIKDNEIPFSLYDIIINIFLYFVQLDDKYSNKLCNLVINLFNNIYSIIKNFDISKNDFYLLELKKYLIGSNINIHRKIFIFLNQDKYPFLVENLLELVNKILFFSEQIDIYEKNKNCLFDKVKKDLIELNIFDEIENI